MSNPLSSVEVPSVFEIARDQGDRNARALYRFLSAVESGFEDIYAQAGGAYGHTVYVDASADSASGNGSASFPFATIGAAVAYVESEGVAGEGYVIDVAAGDYAQEAITITRAKVHLRGPQVYSGQTTFARIGSVTVNIATDAGGVSSTQVCISGFVFVPSSGNCLTIAGSVACSVYMVACNLYAEAGQRCIQCTNASGRLKAFHVEFQNGLSALPCVAWGGAWCELRQANIYPGTGPAVASTAGLVTFDSCSMQGVTGGAMVTASGTAQVNMSNCLIAPSAANSNGVVLSNTAQLTAIQNVFQVPSGTGRCIDGVLGNVVVHALNVFVPTYNSKYNSAIGAGLVPASTTPTLA